MTRAEYLKRSREFVLRGSNSPHAILTADDVKNIRINRDGLTGPKMAARYGVGKSTIYDIWSRHTWSHLD